MAGSLVGRRFKACVSTTAAPPLRRNEPLLVHSEIRQYLAGFHATDHGANRHAENTVTAIASGLIFTAPVFATLRRVALFVAKI